VGLSLLAIVTLLQVTAPDLASAEPNWTLPECRWGGSVWGTAGTRVNNADAFIGANKIYYYVQSGAGLGLSLCNSDPRPVYDQQLANVVQAAAETWNRETRGTELIFGGMISANLSFDSTIAQACALIDVPFRPAVIVGFVPTCIPNSNNTACRTGSSAAVNTIQPGGGTLTDCLVMRFRGNSTMTSCPVGAGSPDWGVTVDYYPSDMTFVPNPDIRMAKADLQAALTHEFGHVLGLGHPESNAVDASGGRAVMTTGAYNTTIYDLPGWPGKRHVFPWDADCVDDRSSVRSVDYRWLEWDPLPAPGSWSTSPDSLSTEWRTTKGVMAGSSFRGTVNGYTYYGLFRVEPSAPETTDWSRSDYVGTDGNLPFSTNQQIGGNTSGVPAGTYLAPQMMTLWEKAWGTGNNARLNFTRMLTDANLGLADGTIAANPATIDGFEPPRWEHRRSDDRFVTTNPLISTSYQYRCTTTNNVFSNDPFCVGNYKPLSTNTSVATAWDPASGRTVFAAVDTWRRYGEVAGTQSEEDRVRANGRIYLAPGLWGPTVNYTLSEANYLPQIINQFDDNDYKYEFETDSSPGIACAPSGSGFDNWLYGHLNCIIAWADRGTPDRPILYSYFRLTQNLSGEWGIVFYGGFFRLDGASSVGNVTAAWFSDAFHIAWKDTLNRPAVRKAINSSTSMSGFVTDTTRYGVDVIDSPTFVHDPTLTDREAGLVWTQP